MVLRLLFGRVSWSGSWRRVCANVGIPRFGDHFGRDELPGFRRLFRVLLPQEVEGEEEGEAERQTGHLHHRATTRRYVE